MEGNPVESGGTMPIFGPRRNPEAWCTAREIVQWRRDAGLTDGAFSMIGRIAGLTLFLLFLAPAAFAEPIPIDQLKKDYEDCVASCPENVDISSCSNYCRCVNAGVQRSFTLEEYTNLATGFATDQVADVALMDRFFAVVEECKPALPQPDPEAQQ